MKKIFYIMLCCIFVFGLTACKNKEEVRKEDKKVEESSKEENKVNTDSKSLVVYFSATGTTKSVAEKIAEVTNSDIAEIIPLDPYTKEDLDYSKDCRANKEQKNSSARPKIKNTIEVNDYDTIYLGYPIWWGDVPKIILTFLDTYPLDGKTVIPFCTSGSTGIEESMHTLKNYNDKITWIEGKRFSSASSIEIEEWMESIMEEQFSKIYIKVNDEVLNVTLENNSSSKAFVEKLKENDITIQMHDYANFEKVGPLGFQLPTNDKEITTTPGDVILYQGDQVTIYYDTNTWNFTKLGHIDHVTKESLKEILRNDDVTVTFSLSK